MLSNKRKSPEQILADCGALGSTNLSKGSQFMSNITTIDGEVKAGAQSVVDKDQRIKRLEAAVSTMDSLSQAGFNQVLSIAKLALTSMEQPEASAFSRAESVAHALSAIWSIAENHVDCITNSAEEVGCEFSDFRKIRRMNAQRAVMEGA